MASKRKHSTELFQKTSMRNEIGKYLKYWPGFLLCIILAGAGAYFYLKYATPVYKASASIIINEDNGNNKGSEMAAYGELGFLSGLHSNNIKKDITILKSRRLMKDVVNILRLNIEYFKEERFREIELYGSTQPFQLTVLKMDEAKLQALGGGKFAISSSGQNSIRVRDLKNGKVFNVKEGNPFNLEFANVVIKTKPGHEKFAEVLLRFSDPEKIASKYRNKVQLIQTDKTSNVIEISLNDPVREKAKDIIDQLILEFNRDAIEDKNLIAGNTAKFINERLEIINSELESVETGKEEFKETNRLTDIQTESRMYVESAREYNSRRQEVGTQLELAHAMLDYLSTVSNTDLLPANLGIQEAGVNQQIGEYNNLVLERNRILGSSTEKNPSIVRLNSRLDQIKNNIRQSLQGMSNNLRISQQDLNRQSSSIGSRILAVPSQERQYRGIERQQSIKEALYLFLLQKREENSLALAITAPKAKIVDRAFSAGGVVSPNSRSIYLGSLFLGLFIPFSLVYLKGVLDNKIRSRNDLKQLNPEITLVGELPKIRKKSDLLIGRNDRSVVAEAFRILITNMRYLQINLGDKQKGMIIFVTSTVKGEGKTFTSINLAATFANNGKKVLILGADLRNPKLEAYKTEHSQSLGVSDYLVNNELQLNSLIDKSHIHENLDILGSGSIPPNPTELLNLPKVGKVFAKLKETYDYIIVDTAPAMMVADTFILSHYADLTLYVIKAGYTEKELLEFAINSKNSGSIKNVGFILNNVDLDNLGYGSSYGYGYEQEKPGLLKRSLGWNAG